MRWRVEKRDILGWTPSIDTQKIYATRFSMVYNEEVLVHMSDSDLQLIVPPQLRKTTQRYQIMCASRICIQDRTYQESLNNWRKQ